MMSMKSCPWKFLFDQILTKCGTSHQMHVEHFRNVTFSKSTKNGTRLRGRGGGGWRVIGLWGRGVIKYRCKHNCSIIYSAKYFCDVSFQTIAGHLSMGSAWLRDPHESGLRTRLVPCGDWWYGHLWFDSALAQPCVLSCWLLFHAELYNSLLKELPWDLWATPLE